MKMSFNEYNESIERIEKIMNEFGKALENEIKSTVWGEYTLLSQGVIEWVFHCGSQGEVVVHFSPREKWEGFMTPYYGPAMISEVWRELSDNHKIIVWFFAMNRPFMQIYSNDEGTVLILDFGDSKYCVVLQVG